MGKRKYEALELLMPAQGWMCAYCAEPKRMHELTLDHVMPRRVGGADEFRNLLGVCFSCNHVKGGSLPRLEFHEMIRRAVHAAIVQDIFR